MNLQNFKKIKETVTLVDGYCVMGAAINHGYKHISDKLTNWPYYFQMKKNSLVLEYCEGDLRIYKGRNER